jgi:hypothetical protein
MVAPKLSDQTRAGIAVPPAQVVSVGSDVCPYAAQFGILADDKNFCATISPLHASEKTLVAEGLGAGRIAGSSGCRLDYFPLQCSSCQQELVGRNR